MTRLEERYRRVLRLLPAWYREVWEEDMVATYLASVDTSDPDDADYAADYGRPSWSEVASVVALAVQLRVGSAGAAPRSTLWGHAIRLAALSAMLWHAASSAVGLLTGLWLAGVIPFLPPPPMPDEYRLLLYGQPWETFRIVGGLLWLPAYLLLVFGRWTAARWLTSIAVVATTVYMVWIERWPGDVFTVSSSYDRLLAILLVAAMFVVFHRDAPPIPRRPWLLALPYATAVVIGYVILLQAAGSSLPPLDWDGVLSVVMVAAAVVYLSARRLGRSSDTWAPALAILAVAVLGMRAASLLDFALFRSFGWPSATVPLGIAEAIALSVVAVMLILLTSASMRRLPSTPGVRTW